MKQNPTRPISDVMIKPFYSITYAYSLSSFIFIKPYYIQIN